MQKTLAHADPEHCMSTKPSLETRNGVSFIFGLLIFLKNTDISLFLLFLWTIMVALLKCFFIHCDGPCTHPKCCRPCVPQDEWDHRGAGSAETEFLFCPVWPLYLWVSVEWTRSEKRRKISETRFSQIQKPWDFLSLQILNDFKIGFVFKIKIRTRNKMLLEMSLWFTDDQALGSLQQHSVSPKEDAEI